MAMLAKSPGLEAWISASTAVLARQVLATLTALLAGNGSSRVRLRADVGYDTLLRMVLRQAGPAGPQQPLLLAIMGPVLEARQLSPVSDVNSEQGR
jgi:hypothetical protein